MAEIDELKATFEQVVAAICRRDAAAYSNFWHEQIVAFPPFSPFAVEGKATLRPMAEANFAQIVSNTCVRGVAQASIEKEVTLEKFRGPAVRGTFARFTEAHWVPMLQGDYPNIATGMFRSGNLWGNFNLLTYDKDGPQFKQGLEILKSMRRKP